MMYVDRSAPGCHVCHGSSTWALSRRPFKRREFGLRKTATVPDLSLDPQRKVLALVNSSAVAKAYFVSIAHTCIGREGTLSAGKTRDEHGEVSSITTLIVTVRPMEVVEACTVCVGRARDVVLHSDIVELSPASPPSEDGASASPLVLGFPLLGSGAPFLCSQGVDGGLTHFAHPSTRHAIDLDAPVGTPVVAVADGVVLSIQQATSRTNRP